LCELNDDQLATDFDSIKMLELRRLKKGIDMLRQSGADVHSMDKQSLKGMILSQLVMSNNCLTGRLCLWMYCCLKPPMQNCFSLISIGLN
jgi:hypothetical protein